MQCNEKIFNMDLGQSEKVSVGAICLLSCVVRCWCSTCTLNNEYSVLKSVLTHLLLLRISWWRHQMETFSALLAICAGNSPVPGEFPTQRPVTRSFDVFFDLRPNKRLSKQWWGWWFLRRNRDHYDVIVMIFAPVNRVSIGLDNGLPPARCQVIMIRNSNIFKKIRLKMSSAKCRPFYLRRDDLSVMWMA